MDLNEINPKTMGVKEVPYLYAIGEVLNIDGFCGGFNLQNAWSTAYICANSINQA
jgi:predicted flavoprotein YhiN